MKKQILIVSNIIFEPYFDNLFKSVFSSHISNYKVTNVTYENVIKDPKIICDADMLVVALNFETLFPNILVDLSSNKTSASVIIDTTTFMLNKLYTTLKMYCSNRLIWLGFEDYAYNYDFFLGSIPLLSEIIEQLNQVLIKLLCDDIFIDLKRLIAKIGITHSYSVKGKYRWNSPYSKELILHLIEEIHKQYLICNGLSPKCLILDCDNVLWGGILSEDGIDGIQIGCVGRGRMYQDFQRYLLMLYYHGVILAICSKNDINDVMQVFREHSGMILKEEHISVFCCNWSNKLDNINQITNTLNINLDSVVFVDDSKHEVEAIKSLLPDITSIIFDGNTIYQKLTCFNLKQHNDIRAIENRTQTYKTNFLRNKLINQSDSFEEYLRLLEMKLDIHFSASHELARISELTQRTNKCTNGKRYTLDKLKDIISLPEYNLYTVCLSDRFSNLGVVGAIGLYGQTLDLFSLSCRALGRDVEKRMIDFVKSLGITKTYFEDTSKNYNLKEQFQLNDLIHFDSDQLKQDIFNNS